MRGAPGKQTVYCEAGWTAPHVPVTYFHTQSQTPTTHLYTVKSCQATGGCVDVSDVARALFKPPISSEERF